jgi:hypothetical protein
MRRSGWVVIVCACSAPPRPVEIPTPLATPPVSIVPLDDEAPLPNSAVLARSSAEGSWAATFPDAPAFTAVELPKSSRVILHWRVGPGRKVKELPPEEDFPGNYLARVDLLVRARGVEKTIELGELAGWPDPAHQSYCARAGFVMPSWRQFGTPPNRSAAAWFSVGVIQGDSEFMIVRDGDVLHVLHRETSDGRCDEKKQGPLDVCDGFEWERVAEVRGTRDAGLFETITTIDASASEQMNHDGAIDCGAERMGGERLTRP